MFVQESNLLGGGLGMILSMISSALLTIPAATFTIFADAFMDSLIPRNANCCFMLYSTGSPSASVPLASVLFPDPQLTKGMALVWPAKLITINILHEDNYKPSRLTCKQKESCSNKGNQEDLHG